MRARTLTPETEVALAADRDGLRAELCRVLDRETSHPEDVMAVLLELAAQEAHLLKIGPEEFSVWAKRGLVEAGARREAELATCGGGSRYCCRRNTYDPRRVLRPAAEVTRMGPSEDGKSEEQVACEEVVESERPQSAMDDDVEERLQDCADEEVARPNFE